MSFRPALVLVLLSAAFSAHAQHVFELFDTGNSGLPYDQVNDLAMDSSGRLWVGTEFGLGAFDGSTWETWNASLDGMGDDVVRSMTVDPDGSRMWVGHFLGGLSRYDPVADQWDIWTPLESPLPDFYVRDLEFTPDGALWIGTTGGLARFDPVADAWQTWSVLSGGLPGNNIPAIHIQEDGTVWIGTINSGLARYNGKGWDNWTIANSDLIDNTILDIDEDDAGNLWLATPAGGLILRTPDGSFLTFNTISSDIPDNEIARLAVGGDSEGWLGMTAAGLTLFDGADWTRYWTGNSNLPEDNVRALLRTREGVAWLGLLGSGLARLDLGDTVSALTGPLAHFDYPPLGPNPFGEALYWAAWEPNPDLEWLIWSLDGRMLAQGQMPYASQAIRVDQLDLPAGPCRIELRFRDGSTWSKTYWHAR